MSKFKAMKFLIGGDFDLYQEVVKGLHAAGYKNNADDVAMPKGQTAIYTTKRGVILYGTTTDRSGYFDPDQSEEINIDWMRKPTRKTVKIGDKEYYEDELAEALSKIKAVG